MTKREIWEVARLIKKEDEPFKDKSSPKKILSAAKHLTKFGIITAYDYVQRQNLDPDTELEIMRACNKKALE